MLRLSLFARYGARLALLLPFAVLGAACGDSSAGTSAEPGAGNDAGGASDGATSTDTTRPTVLSSAPADAATGVSPNGGISVVFSEGMAAATLTDATFIVRQGTNPIPGAVTYFDGTATFLPSSSLSLGTLYTATVTAAATDVAGNALATAYVWTFTSDTTAPRGPSPISLGLAGAYAILGKSAITNVPTSVITGNVGVSPAAASYITGFGLTRAGATWTSPQVVGGVFAADNDAPTPSNLTTAVSNMEAAYTDAAGRPTPTELNPGGGAIGGLVLAPGLYKFTSSVGIDSDVTIAGGPNDVWIFQISGDLTLGAAKRMTLSGGARAKNIVWQVAGAVDFGTTSSSAGIVLSKTSITLETGASLNGRLLAQTAVNIAGAAVTVPAP